MAFQMLAILRINEFVCRIFPNVKILIGIALCRLINVFRSNLFISY